MTQTTSLEDLEARVNDMGRVLVTRIVELEEDVELYRAQVQRMMHKMGWTIESTD